MFEITGGTYIEHCIYPEWHEIYGSGLRAAVSLALCCKNIVRLSSFVAESDRLNVQAIASSFGFDLICGKTDATVAFSYFHGFSTPHIWPHPIAIPDTKPLIVKGSKVLRFGFIEGSAIVHGDKVVYDPQSPIYPKPFAENGSQARELAVIANRREAMLLLGRKGSPAELAELLRKKEKAEIVIIKRGPWGCVLADKKGLVNVPAYETDFVWPLGSGDVFAAFFTYGWAELGLTPVKACHLASKATAYYCSNRSLPIPKGFEKANEFRPVAMGSSKYRQKKKKVYLAGPFFNIGQRWLIEEVRDALLGSGVGVFSPLHEAGTGSAKEVYGPDMAGLKKCDVVLACLDGLDSGTIYEIGYAKAQGKPVIVYVNSEPKERLKMIEGAGCIMTDDLCTAIYKTIWTIMRI